jgi:hypothetical protein
MKHRKFLYLLLTSKAFNEARALASNSNDCTWYRQVGGGGGFNGVSNVIPGRASLIN